MTRYTNTLNEKFEPGIKKADSFGDWTVSLSGRMSYKNGRYSIEADELTEEDWFLQLLGKNWLYWNEFIPAYMQALTNAGHHQIKQNLRE